MTDRKSRNITPGDCPDYGEFSKMCYFNMKVSSSVGYPVGQRFLCEDRIKEGKCPRGVCPMTPQPKEYIITEKQLYGMEYGYRLKTIAKEVRSRPHPAPARTAELMQSAYAHGVMDGERKAREQVLDAILDCSETDGEWFRIDGTDTLYLNYSVLSKKCESLRGGAP